MAHHTRPNGLFLSLLGGAGSKIGVWITCLDGPGPTVTDGNAEGFKQEASH